MVLHGIVIQHAQEMMLELLINLPVLGVIRWYHDDVIKWKHFPRYWPFVRGIPRSPVNSPAKGQWRGALMFSMICTWINDWVNNRGAGESRRHRSDYDVIVMQYDSKEHCTIMPLMFKATVSNIMQWWIHHVCDNCRSSVRIVKNKKRHISLLHIRKHFCQMSCNIKWTTVATIVGLKSELYITKDAPNFSLTFENKPAKYHVAKHFVITRDSICTCSQSFKYSHVCRVFCRFIWYIYPYSSEWLH